jgi:hypothetical protein
MTCRERERERERGTPRCPAPPSPCSLAAVSPCSPELPTPCRLTCGRSVADGTVAGSGYDVIVLDDNGRILLDHQHIAPS